MSLARPGAPFPELSFLHLDGTTLGASQFRGRWTLIVVYRGHHCPRCKAYIAELHRLAPSYAERDVDLLLVSADARPVAETTVKQERWTLPVAYGLTVAQMRAMGLYITAPKEGSETAKPYSEPGIFLIEPGGLLQTISISNAPSARPALDVLLDGIIGTQDRNLPIRGTYVGEA